MAEKLKANKGKKLNIEVDGTKYARLPIKTHVVTPKDDISKLCQKYAEKHLKNGDMLFISERVVAITQGRTYAIKDIKPRLAAKLLTRFVYKSPYGIGLGTAETMELAIKEAGLPRIIAGSLASALTKPFGIRGVFYKVAGANVNAIDGPTEYTLPPYNEYATLAPFKPDKVAKKLKEELGNEVIIIDANDLGVEVLGKSDAGISTSLCKAVFKDNPLGQSSEQTPLCVVRG